MDVLTFIVKFIDVLAWPSVVLILVFALKEQLPELIPGISKILSSLKNLKFGKLEMKFSREIQQLESEVPVEIETVVLDTVSSEKPAQSERLKQLIELSPRLAIIEAWRIVELSAVDFLRKQLDSTDLRFRSVYEILDSLESNEFITKSTGRFFRKLNRLRNHAAHSTDFDISEQDARGYMHSALNFAIFLEFGTGQSEI